MVRFVAIGDVGKGNSTQFAVGQVMESVCADQGCDFVLMAGDNIYDSGVSGVNDGQWQDKFELPYANLDMNFYPALGNHDGGAFGAGLELNRGDVQVEYTSVSDKWTMPSRFYKHAHGNADFFAFDTSSIFFDSWASPYADLTDEQADFFENE